MACGLLACVFGAILSAIPPRARGGAALARSNLPTLWVVAAALAYGIQFWILGSQVTPELGLVVSVFLYYATGLAILLLVRVRYAPPLRLPAGRARLFVVSTAVVAVGGYLAISAGLATGQIAIVAVLSSFQSGVTVLLAWVVLKERLALHQALGLTMVICGLAMIHTFE